MTNKDLYEQDYLAWLEETAKQLRQRQTDVLDWEHLEEEIEANCSFICSSTNTGRRNEKDVRGDGRTKSVTFGWN